MKIIIALAVLCFMVSVLAGWRIRSGSRDAGEPTGLQTGFYVASVVLFAVGGIYGAATGDPAGWLALALIPLLSIQGEFGGELRESKRSSRGRRPSHPLHD